MNLLTLAAMQLGAVELARHGWPIGISTLMDWAASVWVALWVLRELKDGFGWRKLATPARGLFQLAGLVIAMELVRPGGLNAEMAGNPCMWGMFVASVLNAWLVVSLKALKRREKKVFLAAEGAITDEDEKFLSGKVMLFPSVIRALCSIAGLGIWGSMHGYPHVAHWRGMLAAIGFMALAALGNRLAVRANIEGDTGLNAVGATASLGFGFLWNFMFQGLAITLAQIAGSLMTLAGAAVQPLIDRKSATALRGHVKERLNRRRRKE